MELFVDEMVLKLIKKFDSSSESNLISFSNNLDLNIIQLNPWSTDNKVWKINDSIIYKYYPEELIHKKDYESYIYSFYGVKTIVLNRGYLMEIVEGVDSTNTSIDINFINLVFNEIKLFRQKLADSNILITKKTMNNLHNFEITNEYVDLSLKQYELIENAFNTISKRPLVPSHGDLNARNILYNDGQIKFIDFEYSRFDLDIWDISSFVSHSNIDKKNRDILFKLFNIDQNTMILSMVVFIYSDMMANLIPGVKYNKNEKILYGKKQYKKLIYVLKNNDLNW